MNMLGTKLKHPAKAAFNPLQFIRKNQRFIAFFLFFLFFTGIIRPQKLLALTGGPSAPEVNSPSKITASKMVDPFTGNLDYSIPILEVGGYPLSLSYDADISMDQEASWVGLGWSLNPGSISRSVRGLPDDFKKKDKVKKDFNTKPNVKAGLNAGINLELFGLDALGAAANLGASIGLFYDTYQGLGLNYSLSPSISVASNSKGILTASMGMNGGSHKNGVSLDPSLSLPQRVTGVEKLTLSSSMNSLSGMKSVNLNVGQNNGVRNYNASFNSFADRSYKPKIKFPMISTHGSFSLAVGGEVFGTFPSGSFTGYYSQSHLETKHKELPAYGYMYTEAANNGPDALLDYKREKDGQYTTQKPNLPIPNYTYDVFNISGSGLSGSFRPHRGDIGVLYDHRVKSLGGDKAVAAVGGLSISGEIGGGNLVKVGINLKTNNSVNTSGLWDFNNDIVDKASSVASGSVSEKDYEPFYFKMSGEKQVRNNTSYYDKIVGSHKTSVQLAGSAGEATQTLNSSEAASQDLENSVYKKNREKRKKSIAYLTAAQADRMAVSRKIRDYPLNSTPLDPSSVSAIDRLDGKRKKHHLSQIAVKKQGKRYVYGIPAYNNMKKEVSFNVDHNSASCQDGLVQYNKGTSNSTDNKSGLNHYFSATTTPAYAYSFLLSSVVSESYVDLTGDGPTPDDLGQYTRFNYSRVHKNYRWRSPYRRTRANYQENKYSLDNDNMASYVYGKKEIWYINSIETRNYVAQFIVTNRKDALGVKGENGGRDQSMKQKKLSKIKLFARSDLKEHGKNAEPLKVVHFEYDYSLTPGVPNHVNANSNKNNGKLTLQKVYFTYGDSEKGRFSPYDFTYHKGQHNPSYQLKASDRFGFYKKNACGNTNRMNNTASPYVLQDSTMTNRFVKAWKLKQVDLPSGGTMTIHYESDDYAYVQDRRAMQMFRVKGFANSKNPSSLSGKNQLYQNQQSYQVNEYLFFELEKPVDSRQKLKAYLPVEPHLFFKTKVDVVGKGIQSPPTDPYEYVSGFAEYTDYGVYKGQTAGGGGYTHAWIKLKKVEIGDFKLKPKFAKKKANPIAKRTWTYAKNNLPKHAFKRSDVTDNWGDQLANALTSIKQMVTMLKSLNSQLINRNFARQVKLNKTLIRLNVPDGKKLGGGHRVKKIVMSDQWSKMTSSGKTSTYGKVYDYTTRRNGKNISSGVIAWEPRMGKEENPFHQPVFYNHNGDRLFMTKPFGSSFFPGAKVGYSRVEIRELPHPNANPAPAGYEVRKFYTAKDFPVITRRTDLQDKHERPGPFASFNPFKHVFNERRAVSQGYKVVLNDMHGKPKAKYTYRHGTETPLSGTRYTYKLDDKGRLDNTVKVVKGDMSLADATVGVTIDFVLDSRQQKSVTEMQGMNINTDTFMASIVPVVVPFPASSYKMETVRFRSIVATKVVRKKGIVDEVIKYKNGSSLKTKNLAFDALTGEPLIKKNQNKFGGYTYTTKIPAHHQYEGMEPGYQNINATFENVQVASGEIRDRQVNRLLTKGDKLYWTHADDKTNYNKAWVLKNNPSRSVVINMQGNLLSDDTYNFRVIRSGYDDKATSNIGAVTSMKNPINGNKVDLNRNLNVLLASAKKYKDDWQTYAGYSVEHVPVQCNCSQVRLGKGSEFSTIMRTIELEKDGSRISNPRAARFIADKMGADPDFVTIHKERVGNKLFVTFKMEGEGEEHCEIALKNLQGDDLPEGGSLSNFQYVKKDPHRCDTVYSFKADYTYQYKDTVALDLATRAGRQLVNKSRTVRVAGHSGCFPIATCKEEPLESYFTCNLVPGDVVNPFVNGIEGIWRPYKEYEYHTSRVTGRMPESGHYKNFTPFTWSGKPSNQWVWKNETTTIDPFGAKLEEVDPLGNYAANIYGYSYSKVKASVQNSPHNQAGFDGFEDYAYYNDLVNVTGECEPQKHIQFYLPRGTSVTGSSFPSRNLGFITDEASHTGEYSARVTTAAPIKMKRKTHPMQGGRSQGSTKEYVLQKDDFVGIFTPKPGKYHISAWVKDKLAHANYNTLTYDFPKITVQADGSNVSTLKPSGPLVDGWQKITGNIRIPENTDEVTIKMATDFGIAYFDDFRIHPYNAQMKGFVHNPYNLRHTATLDNNNYAVFYQYNEEGEFMGTKKETRNGIITVKESRQGSYKSEK